MIKLTMTLLVVVVGCCCCLEATFAFSLGSFVKVIPPKSFYKNLLPEHHPWKRSTRLLVTRDEYLQPHFEAPPRTVVDMDRIVVCAESSTGECSVNEMMRLMEELDRLNAQSTNELVGTFSVDDTTAPSVDASMTARQAAALKKKLQCQVDSAKQELRSGRTRVLDEWRTPAFDPKLSSSTAADTLSFQNHPVDYRAIAEYESH